MSRARKAQTASAGNVDRSALSGRLKAERDRLYGLVQEYESERSARQQKPRSQERERARNKLRVAENGIRLRAERGRLGSFARKWESERRAWRARQHEPLSTEHRHAWNKLRVVEKGLRTLERLQRERSEREECERGKTLLINAKELGAAAERDGAGLSELAREKLIAIALVAEAELCAPRYARPASANELDVLSADLMAGGFSCAETAGLLSVTGLSGDGSGAVEQRARRRRRAREKREQQAEERMRALATQRTESETDRLLRARDQRARA